MQEKWTIRSIREAVTTGVLSEAFGTSDVNRSLGIAYAGTLLPKHRVGNPGSNTELFIQISHRPSYRASLRRAPSVQSNILMPCSALV
jgi:hypothetical protein